MSMLRIKPVPNRSKLTTLREYGHRAFVEVGDDGQPIGYFVEYKESMDAPASKGVQRTRSRPTVTGNVALQWAGRIADYREGTLIGEVAGFAAHLATIPTRRSELLQAITKELPSRTEAQVSNAISYLTTDGHLVVPG